MVQRGIVALDLKDLLNEALTVSAFDVDYQIQSVADTRTDGLVGQLHTD
jgi:hypothetical protein